MLGDGVLAQAKDANIAFFQFPPYVVSGGEGVPSEQHFNRRRTYRRTASALARLLANMGVSATPPLLSRFSTPVGGAGSAASLVRNGDFSQAGPAGPGAAPDQWEFSSDIRQAACAREPLDAGGGWAVRLTMSGSAGKNQNVMLAQHDMPVKNAQWYRISLKARAEGMGGKPVTLALADTRKWRSLFEYQYFTPSETWRTFHFLLQSQGTAEKDTRFQIWHGNGGTLWLADVAVVPVPPPTEGRWLQGLYLDQPVNWDDPYRFFRW